MTTATAPIRPVRFSPEPAATLTPADLDALRHEEDAARLAGERLLNQRLAERERPAREHELAA